MNYVHPEARKFLDATSGAPPLDSRSPEENRAAQRQGVTSWGEGAEMALVSDVLVRGVPVRVYVPKGLEHDQAGLGEPAFIYFHGGGWVLGDLDTNDSSVRDIADAASVVCFSVDYRRAPEHPFPAALEDCLDVVNGLLAGETDFGIDPARIAIGGDSAGGNIAAVIAQERREAIAHQVLVYPVMDLSSFDTESHYLYSNGYFLTRRRLEYFYDSYAGEMDRRNVRLSPGLNTDLSGLPPATVITAEFDPLVSEISNYVGGMLEAGNSVAAIEFKGQIHPFLQMGGAISDALIARRVIGTVLRHALRGV